MIVSSCQINTIAESDLNNKAHHIMSTLYAKEDQGNIVPALAIHLKVRGVLAVVCNKMMENVSYNNCGLSICIAKCVKED